MFGSKKKESAKEEAPLSTAPAPKVAPKPDPKPDPKPEPKPEAKRKLTVKVADLDFEIARQPGSNNFRLYHEDGREYPVSDVNTLLLWEILKAVSK